MYRGVQRTTAAEVDSRLEHSSTMNTETSTSTTEIFESEKLSNNSENERTTIVPYNLNEYGSESQYEVDLSEVELLKTTEKSVAVNEDKKNNVEDRKVKRRDEEDKVKDKRQRNRKGKQKGRNHSSKYSFQILSWLGIALLVLGYKLKKNSEFYAKKVKAKMQLISEIPVGSLLTMNRSTVQVCIDR